MSAPLSVSSSMAMVAEGPPIPVRKYSYEAKMTKEEYEQGLLKDFIKTIYGGSMPKLLSAFVGIHAISEEEAEEIKKILEDK